MTRWYRRVRLVTWAIWSFMALWAAAQWRTPNADVSIPTKLSGMPGNHHTLADSSTSLLVEVLARMPFDNAEALQLQSESPTASPDASASQMPSLQLTLSGIVDGKVQQAIIVGLPGTDGSRTLRIGERVGTARLLEVSAQRAVVAVNGTRVELLIGKPTLLSP
ncbi:MAG: type II secretion system protein N [Gemmatimonadaceae bacterium]